jgi:hypothetical protein
VTEVLLSRFRVLALRDQQRGTLEAVSRGYSETARLSPACSASSAATHTRRHDMDDDLLLAVTFQRCRDGRPLSVDEFH